MSSNSDSRPASHCDVWEAPPPDFFDPVIEAYKRDVDRTLLRENLRLSVAERFERFDRAMQLDEELRAAGASYRENSKEAAAG